MRRVILRDTNGRPWPHLVPESDREARELKRRTDIVDGGIDERFDVEDEDDDFSDE